MMQVFIYNDAHSLGRGAAKIVSEAVMANPSLKLGFPTGSTPIGMYAELVQLHQRGRLSFNSAWAFNLDEYVGLAATSSQSYNHFMASNLFNHVDLPLEHRFIPDGMAASPEDEANRYDTLLAEHGPLDLLILGIGTNGHIGFNEPGSAWDSPCRVVDLSEETITANARFFTEEGEQVPKQAITMGMAAILSAKRILLLAMGSSKAACIRGALQEPPTLELPASALQGHSNLTVLLDKEAAAMLR